MAPFNGFFLVLAVGLLAVVPVASITRQPQLSASVVSASYRPAQTTGITESIVQNAYNILNHQGAPHQGALCGQAGSTEGSTVTCSPPPPPQVPRKMAAYTGTAFGTHHDANGPDKHLCDPGQGPNPSSSSNCGRQGITGARGGQAGEEYGATASHGAATCYPASYPAAFPPPTCHDTPEFVTTTNTPAHQAGWKGSTIQPPDAIGTASTKGGPNPWQVPTLAPPPPSHTALVNSQTTGIAPSGSCNVGPNGHADTQSGFIPQDFQLPLTCHSNQNTGSAGWSISGGTAPTSQTLKNYHWHSHNTFAPGVTASPNRQWMASPCAMPVYKTAYCLAPDRVLLGGATGQIPGELAVPAAAVDGNLNAPVLAAGGR